MVGWGAPERRAWPVGQAVGLADGYRRTYGSTGRLVQAVLAAGRHGPEEAARLRPLAPDAPLARSHGTRYPIVQGPMTRVSDTPAFARAVAEAGAVPMLALALMDGERARPLLEETRALLGERPWGVGILGFVPAELRDVQIKEIRRIKPRFALIAGGHPHQVRVLEEEGIATYAHVPAPTLLDMFVDQGTRRFVFEGEECGGHVGPLSSFALWESMVHALLERLPRGEEESCHVLFAGGIHDARSAAAVAAFAAPLARRGIKTGVLMGTAYMFTREAVATGAIVPAFQDEVVSCQGTTLLEAGVGHANRCAATAFARGYRERRLRLIREGCPAEDMRKELDGLQLGRLRLATKGLARDSTGTMVTLDAESQRRDGMYMVGDVASIRERLSSLTELHAEVCEGAARLLADRFAVAGPSGARSARSGQPSDIAIIGLSLLLPGARDLDRFWANIVARTPAITEIPAEYWDWRLYYDPERRAPDKIYSKWGGFFGDVPFDPLEFGIPPVSMEHISVSQLLALRQTKLALEDAGYAERQFDRENTAVVIASADNGGYLGQQFVTRATLPLKEGATDERVLRRLAEWSEESFAGVLTNVTAGRVANRFDLGGPNYTVDAACAAALSALGLGVRELDAGSSNLAIVGGIDVGQSPFAYLGFSKTQALSPSGRARVFDKSADGIVISEGIAMMVLKRLADAERDGDRVYAVIKAVAGSSDGRGLSMTAPKPEGQLRSLRRAYAKAGFPATTIQLYEAHGTGTVVGDDAEVQTVLAMLNGDGARPAGCAVGSIKSLVGHTKTAAGLVGLAKAALALHHRTLPPHWGVEDPLDPLRQAGVPTYLLEHAKPWLAAVEPRRAGVSGFGFGGTNAHAVLEEYRGDLRPTDPGGHQRPCELVVFAGATREALVARLREVHEALSAGSGPRLRDLAYSAAVAARSGGQGAPRIAAVVADAAELRETLASALAHLGGSAEGGLPHNLLIADEIGPRPGAVAFLFPGQGSHAINMGREQALYFEEFREALEAADAVLADALPKRLSDYVYPPQAFGPEQAARQFDELTDTHVAQPAIGALSAAYVGLLESLGLVPDMVGGHSYGEYTAMLAAGVLGREDFLELSKARGRLMASCGGDHGTMAAIFAPRATVEAALASEPDVVLANHNAPHQAVISGRRQSVERAAKRLAAEGARVVPLAVSNGFHSPLMRPAKDPLAEIIAGLDLRPPRCPVFANATGERHADDAEALRAALSEHLLAPVEFVREIESMYREGARIFIEVGPGTRLVSLVGRILEDRPHVAVPTEGGGGGLRDFLLALARLYAQGLDLRLERLFERRDAIAKDLTKLLREAMPAEVSKTTWLVNGMRARPLSADRTATRLPDLDLETREQDKAKSRPHRGVPTLEPGNGGEPPMRGEGVGEAHDSDPVLGAYEAYQETMREFLRTQEAVLREFLGGVSEQAVLQGAFPGPASRASATVADPTPAADEQPPAAAPRAEDTDEPADDAELNRESLTGRLVRLVGERTGYPAEMLGVEFDIEAELGIDSIKRVEIIDAFVQTLPSASRARLDEHLTDIVRVKTLAGVIDRVVALAARTIPAGTPAAQSEERAPDGGTVPAEAPAVAEAPMGAGGQVSAEGAASGWPDEDRDRESETAAPSESGRTAAIMRRGVLRFAGETDATDNPASAGCARYVMQPVRDSLPALPSGRPRGLYVITGDGGGVADALARLLEDHGAVPVILDPGLCTEPDALAAVVLQHRRERCAVRGILHLAGLSPENTMPERLGEWRRLTQRCCKSLYQLLALCREDLTDETQSQMGRVVAATALGGCFGRNGTVGPGPAVAGGALGLLNTLDVEWSSVLAKCVDFDDSLDASAIARRLFAEMLFPSGRVEVGYPGGVRTVFRPVAAPLDTAAAPVGPRPSPDWVVLATGGARGITAEAAAALAVPGMRLVLVGRSPEVEAEPATWASPDDLRRQQIEHAREQGVAMTPAEVEARVKAVLRDREVRQTLARFREAGVEVEYRAVDVRDEGAFGGLIADLYERFGRIDAVLHGAGVIEDRRVGDKDLASMERVFDTKVDGAFVLWRYLRAESLKLVMLFSSTAGRFGNVGQADYAAANEVLNRMAWCMRGAWPTARVVAINWGPWAESGMASATVNRRFRARRIEPITNAAGRAFIVNEVRHGGGDDVEVIAGEGPWHVSVPPMREAFFDLDMGLAAASGVD
ncbi:MAG: SDR family NAD(P)-dependent oxidoreductase [Gammaproteobacteria bacterium]|nr:SDR family NAD(P)-dependent oxidoreductase [Gammaproteobacteria bacterium]NIR81724.1 SDR family NAD(P)-dependent oxidoreductase [Gammaproteobacteria bacterium]NIR88527.1 SDR family NAD(P)-dependent oxidoreductase [Gammaproteobacteria bacterium]NIU02831.1 SDR family NAD(P)-dependent oxidoreductase [Gammaproteobacteria bacterium]NIV50353.1 SDR family NAD(P)-dependent oxidoreductase [Gammaproteobacteria bacterium]